MKPTATTTEQQWQSSASSSSRLCRTSGASPSSCGPPLSTTSASYRRSSGSGHRPGAGRISVDVQSELSDARLPADTETALYRIAQEAFTNVLKHAGAARVTLRLSRRDDTVTLFVHDDGKGFDPANVREGSLGLLGMRERVALLGGRLTIDSSDGAGTMLRAEVPVR